MTIDIEAAKNKKIVITNAPNVLNDAVAETTLLSNVRSST